ncbi:MULTISPECIES: RNA-binding S4 domain-containing protein [Helicobacter]|uniref:RNA-binding S4 domain-containing protein n=1 Tax=Helicobacter ibis TaxID=2962633 RepID=A0ABT4VGJ8_9HELI|nr:MULTISPECIES: RNA-binding S4 domain-containing protein [Helicobacter]MDA3967108.1 RNA-binding S4 domain-containing protein [Helicobacter sp. WB40]MDA3969235.1 RNA-binding S4 domain-containing protein [Helicobacter ibis]
MRVDKFLNAVNITKRRTIAQDMIENSVVKIDGIAIKASRNVKVGDIIEIAFLEKSRFYEVLKIPETKTIKKNESHLYYREKL